MRGPYGFLAVLCSQALKPCLFGCFSTLVSPGQSSRNIRRKTGSSDWLSYNQWAGGCFPLPLTNDQFASSGLLGPQIRIPQNPFQKKEIFFNACCFQAQEFTSGVCRAEALVPEWRDQNQPNSQGIIFHLTGSLQMLIRKIVREGPVLQFLTQFESSFNDILVKLMDSD